MTIEPMASVVVRRKDNVADSTRLSLPKVVRFHALKVRTRFGLGWLSFLLVVAVPTMVTAGYLSLIASSEYVAEARIVVRAASDDSLRRLTTDFLSIATMFSGSKSSQQDTHIVVGYIRGRGVVDDLGGKQEVERVYSRPDVDWLSALGKSSSFEDVWKYWKKKVTAVLDVPSGIVTISVRAFSREDARDLASRLVALSERLVNEISERARADTLKYAEAELLKARRDVEDRRQTLSSFRNQQEILDPTIIASSIAETLAELTKEKLRSESQIAVLRTAMGEDTQTLKMLRARISSIEEQIRRFEARLASTSNNGSVLANQIAGYERLQLELKFAEKLNEIAESAFKKAQLEAQKQQLYLIPVVRPTMPEDALYPRPVLDSLLVFVWLTILWGVGALTIAGIRDPR
jgi:capsular polysaccharide transport system permease protein